MVRRYVTKRDSFVRWRHRTEWLQSDGLDWLLLLLHWILQVSLSCCGLGSSSEKQPRFELKSITVSLALEDTYRNSA